VIDSSKPEFEVLQILKLRTAIFEAQIKLVFIVFWHCQAFQMPNCVAEGCRWGSDFSAKLVDSGKKSMNNPDIINWHEICLINFCDGCIAGSLNENNT
jgi:hypothetical protein